MSGSVHDSGDGINWDAAFEGANYQSLDAREQATVRGIFEGMEKLAGGSFHKDEEAHQWKLQVIRASLNDQDTGMKLWVKDVGIEGAEHKVRLGKGNPPEESGYRPVSLSDTKLNALCKLFGVRARTRESAVLALSRQFSDLTSKVSQVSIRAFQHIPTKDSSKASFHINKIKATLQETLARSGKAEEDITRVLSIFDSQLRTVGFDEKENPMIHVSERPVISEIKKKVEIAIPPISLFTKGLSAVLESKFPENPVKQKAIHKALLDRWGIQDAESSRLVSDTARSEFEAIKGRSSEDIAQAAFRAVLRPIGETSSAEEALTRLKIAMKVTCPTEGIGDALFSIKEHLGISDLSAPIGKEGMTFLQSILPKVQGGAASAEELMKDVEGTAAKTARDIAAEIRSSAPAGSIVPDEASLLRMVNEALSMRPEAKVSIDHKERVTKQILSAIKGEAEARPAPAEPERAAGGSIAARQAMFGGAKGAKGKRHLRSAGAPKAPSGDTVPITPLSIESLKRAVSLSSIKERVIIDPSKKSKAGVSPDRMDETILQSLGISLMAEREAPNAVYRRLLDGLQGVDPSLVTKQYVLDHVKEIFFKQALEGSEFSFFADRYSQVRAMYQQFEERLENLIGDYEIAKSAKGMEYLEAATRFQALQEGYRTPFVEILDTKAVRAKVRDGVEKQKEASFRSILRTVCKSDKIQSKLADKSAIPSKGIEKKTEALVSRQAERVLSKSSGSMKGFETILSKVKSLREAGHVVALIEQNNANEIAQAGKCLGSSLRYILNTDPRLDGSKITSERGEAAVQAAYQAASGGVVGEKISQLARLMEDYSKKPDSRRGDKLIQFAQENEKLFPVDASLISGKQYSKILESLYLQFLSKTDLPDDVKANHRIETRSLTHEVSPDEIIPLLTSMDRLDASSADWTSFLDITGHSMAVGVKTIDGEKNLMIRDPNLGEFKFKVGDAGELATATTLLQDLCELYDVSGMRIIDVEPATN